jgi:hypothetical protein
MQRHRLITAAAALALAASLQPSARAAEPPNLIFNGNFTEVLSGWSRTANVSWSPEHGGAARVVQLDNAQGSDVLIQCVPVLGGHLYDLSASAFVPAQASGTGGVSVRVRWHASGSCSGNPLSGSPALDFPSERDWQRRELRLTRAPDGASSALVLVVVRSDASGDYELLVDDLTLARSTEVATLMLPTAASVTGALGQRFQTDLWVQNGSNLDRRFTVFFYPAGRSGGPVTPVVLNLAALETRFLPDVLHDLFGFRDLAGALRIDYDPLEGPIHTAARAISVHPEQPGNGMGIPLQAPDAARASAVFLGLPGDGSRVNVGAFNPSPEPVRVAFTAKDASGAEIGTVERVWQPYEWFQIDDVLAPGGGEAASISVQADLPVLPFAIAIDNRSADPTYLSAY